MPCPLKKFTNAFLGMLELHNEMQLKRSTGQSPRWHIEPWTNWYSLLFAGTYHEPGCCLWWKQHSSQLLHCPQGQAKTEGEGGYWKCGTQVKLILYNLIRHDSSWLNLNCSSVLFFLSWCCSTKHTSYGVKSVKLHTYYLVMVFNNLVDR